MEYAQLTPGPGYAPLQSLLYYSQRLITAPRLRQLIIAGLRARIRTREGMLQCEQTLTESEAAILQTLNGSGFSPLGELLSRRQIADIHAFLKTKSLAARRQQGRTFTIENVPDDVRVADYDLKDIVACPHLLELANRPSLLRLASHYIGCKPTISAVGLRWSFPNASNGMDVQLFHRDSDDWRYFKVFVYLTDVDREAGPHVYVRGTHLTKAPMRLRFYSDDEIRQAYGDDRTAVVTGPSGFGFASDTSGIHKGMVPSASPRLLLQIQYSLLPAYAYRYRPVTHKGSSGIDSYINRLILE